MHFGCCTCELTNQFYTWLDLFSELTAGYFEENELERDKSEGGILKLESAAVLQLRDDYSNGNEEK